ncbi:tetratricopeptide repeat protein [Arenimonas composti]|nr:tetratricopeptide repeat protein [Arenimonas composti]
MNRRSEGDIFAPVHRALRRGRVASALRLLLDDAGRLQRRFEVDRNHAWYLVGDGRYRRREFHEAIRAFRRALASDPADDDAMMALANCHSELGNPRWSRHYLTQALRLAPGNPALLYNLGNAWFDSGEFATAIGLYRRAAKRAAPELKTACGRNEALARLRSRGTARSRRDLPGERQ